jgi:hypothetical protein
MMEDGIFLPYLSEKISALNQTIMDKENIDIEALHFQCLDLLEHASIPEETRRSNQPWAHLKALTPDLKAILGHVPNGWTVLCDTDVRVNVDVSHRVALMLQGRPALAAPEKDVDIMWADFLRSASRNGMPARDWSDGAKLNWILFSLYGFHWHRKRNLADDKQWTKSDVLGKLPQYLDQDVQEQVQLAVFPPKDVATPGPNPSPCTA